MTGKKTPGHRSFVLCLFLSYNPGVLVEGLRVLDFGLGILETTSAANKVFLRSMSQLDALA